MTIDEATPGWGMPGCRGEKTPAPKDVEPDFARVAQDAGCLPMQFGTFMRYTLQQHEIRLMRAAFAAGRQAAPQSEDRIKRKCTCGQEDGEHKAWCLGYGKPSNNKKG